MSTDDEYRDRLEELLDGGVDARAVNSQNHGVENVVTESMCEAWRARRENGETTTAIADDVGRSHSTVTRHIRGECKKHALEGGE